MPNEFISPNWHVVLLHAPLGLLVVGVLIELLSFISPRGGFRAAGRWMMLVGSLLAIPTITAGIYAFRDVVIAQPLEVGTPWQQIAQQSTWLPEQWQAMEWHIWLNATAVVLLTVVAIFWLAGSDDWRRSAYWPLLILTLAAMGLLVAGARHGGELVYRYGTGVDLGLTPDVAGAGVAQPAPGGTQRDIRFYVPPLQLHMVVAGFAAAFAVAAFALMIRRWHLGAYAAVPLEEGRPVTPGVPREREAIERAELQSQRPYGAEDVPVPPRVYPGWFWLGAFLLAVGAAVGGAWSVTGVFTRAAIEENLQELQDADHLRLLLHVIFGVSIVVLSLMLAGLVRFAWRWKVLTVILGVVVLLLIAGQVWLGSLMTFDGHSGPLFGFAAAVTSEYERPAQQQLDYGPDAPATQPQEQPSQLQGAPTAAEPPTTPPQPFAPPTAQPSGPQEQPVLPVAPAEPQGAPGTQPAAGPQELTAPDAPIHEEVGAPL